MKDGAEDEIKVGSQEETFRENVLGQVGDLASTKNQPALLVHVKNVMPIINSWQRSFFFVLRASAL